METPADRVRRAADVLRERAAKTTPGPWRYNPKKQWYGPGSKEGEEFVAAMAGPICVASTGPADHPQSMRDAEFVATMDPMVAEALVGWLDTCVRYMEKWPGDVQLNSAFKTGGYMVACAILGEQP